MTKRLKQVRHVVPGWRAKAAARMGKPAGKPAGTRVLPRGVQFFSVKRLANNNHSNSGKQMK